jgi:hypothetical protein
MLGRSLLRERLPLRTRPLGECPRCGRTMLGATDDWVDAERVVTDHLLACELQVPVQREVARPRAILRPAI